MPIVPDLPQSPPADASAIVRSTVRDGERLTEVPLVLLAGTSPRVDFTLLREASPATTEPYDLQETELEFHRKARTQDSDTVALYTSEAGGITILDVVGGRVSVLFAATDLPRSGQFRYRLDTVKDGRTTTVAWGPMTVLSR